MIMQLRCGGPSIFRDEGWFVGGKGSGEMLGAGYLI